MKIKILVISISAILIVGGCGIESKESAINYNEAKVIEIDYNEIKESVDEAVNAYKNNGLLGSMELIKNCNASYEVEHLKCISYEYTGYFIDKGMSELNRFPMDDFFKIELLNKRLELIRNSQSENERFSAEKIEYIKKIINEFLNGRKNKIVQS